MTVSIDELRERLLEQARKKAEEIIKEAEKRAEEIIAQAEAEWMEKSRRERERILSEARMRGRIIVSEAKRKARIEVTKAKYEVLEDIFNEAWKRISSREGYDVEKSLRSLLDEALMFLESPKELRVSEIDVETAEKITAEKGLSVEIVKANITGGLILVDESGNRVDNSYDTRFKRSRETLLPTISSILWG